MRTATWLGQLALCSTASILGTVPRTAEAQEIDLTQEPAAAPNLETTIAQALEHFRAGRFSEALTLFDAAVASSTEGNDRSVLEFNAAVCAYAIHSYANAQRRFEALAAQPSRLASLAEVHAGLAAVRAHDLPAARRHRLVVLKDDAELARAHRQLTDEIAEVELNEQREFVQRLINAGFTSLEHGQSEQARRILYQAHSDRDAATASEQADIHYGLGLIEYEQGALAEARRHFELSLAARPSDVEAWLALGQVCEAQYDAACARRCYDAALRSRATPHQRQRAVQALSHLYHLPVGPSVLGALGSGYDSNADQTGTHELTATGASTRQASAFISAVLDASWQFQSSTQTTVGPYYSADLLALLHSSVRDLSLQTHELGVRFAWAPSLKQRLELEGGAAYQLAGLDPVEPFSWETAAAAKFHLRTSIDSRARVQLGVRGSNATELNYLDGYRVDAGARELWVLGAWELSAELLFRYNSAGVEETFLDETIASCTYCDQPYLIPLSYWSPGTDLSIAWEATHALRLSLSERIEHRAYTETNGSPDPSAPRHFFQKDWRFRTLLGADLALDRSGTLHLTLDHTVLVNSSNMAFEATDPERQLDRNFTQNISELGIQVWL